MRAINIIGAGLLLAIAIGKGPSAAQVRPDRTFSSQELGFPELDTTITFSAESDRVFRVHYSKLPAQPDLAMLYTTLYFCAARKMAIEMGFDRSGMLADPGPNQGGTAFFLHPGESAAQVLESRFAAASTLPVDFPTIAAECDRRASRPK